MLISASYKTDIPTFYGEWFMNRLRQGYCKVVNAYNNRISRVSLDCQSVDAIVFWTKNVGPFLKQLPEIDSLGYPFVVQHTVNNYPRALETSVVDADRAVSHIQSISRQYGASVCVWRYDTIVFSSLTPFTFHLTNFAELATKLSGHVDEVVISTAHVYKKTRRNLDLAAKELGFTWVDPEIELKKRLVAELADIAMSQKIQLTVCSQPELIVGAATVARCVDADRISRVTKRDVSARLKGNRKECGCYHSFDIGEYDTCPHGCVYCYAVQNPELALERYKQHDPTSEFLFPPPPSILASDDDSGDEQLTLFPIIE
jgi:Domain of unknown function (DUF1848)